MVKYLKITVTILVLICMNVSFTFSYASVTSKKTVGSLKTVMSSKITAKHMPKPITLPSKSAIVKTMEAVNDYFISWNFDYGDCDWDRAVYFTGNMACYEATGNKKYLEFANNWAEMNNWTTFDVNWVNENSQPWPRKFGDTDEYCCGQTYLALYDIRPSPEKIEGIVKHVDGIISPTMNQWWYVDNLYMGGPVLSKLASLTKNKKYSDALYALYTDAKITRKLYDTKEHLWYRDERYLWPAYQSANGKKCFWSRGNGWAIAGLARILKTLPKDDKHRQEYITNFKEMAAALIKVQGSDGIWRAGLYDYKEYPTIESSGTALFTYALAWGINNGLLDKKTYYPVVAKAWNGLISKCININGITGFVGYVQVQADDPSYGQPIQWDKSEDYGYGAVLLAGSELIKIK